jgi:hypothetical protein
MPHAGKQRIDVRIENALDDHAGKTTFHRMWIRLIDRNTAVITRMFLGLC